IERHLRLGSDRAFLLVDSPLDNPKRGKVVWITYDHKGSLSVSGTVWGWHLVRHPDKRNLYVVKIDTFGNSTIISVYEVNRNNNCGQYPLKLPPKKRHEWPQSALPLSYVQKEFPQEERWWWIGLNPNRAQILIEDNCLLVFVERQWTQLRSACFRFNVV